jgi:hypothetical protein
MSCAWIDDVVVAHAVLVEVTLIVAGRGDRGIVQRNACDHFFLAIGMTDAHDPRLAEAVADDTAVAAGCDERTRNAAALQERDSAVD